MLKETAKQQPNCFVPFAYEAVHADLGRLLPRWGHWDFDHLELHWVIEHAWLRLSPLLAPSVLCRMMPNSRHQSRQHKLRLQEHVSKVKTQVC